MNASNQVVVTRYALAPTRTVAAAGITFTYRELGPTGGVPVVFLVHLAATLDNWDPRIVDAVAAGHHVIAVDNRGVGASTGSVPGTVEAMADDTYAFVTALGHELVDVVGFSLGGFVAQVLVERHPDLVRRLVLAGTGPRGGSGIAKVPAVTFYDIVRAGLARVDPKAFLFFGRDPEGKRAATAFLERLEERTSDRDAPMAVTGFLAQLVAITRWGLGTPSDLSKVHQPTLIANGDHDRMVPSALSRDLHHRIPGSELVVFPDSGHGGVFQHHEAFAPALVEFLDRPEKSVPGGEQR
ncbi:alpha/beta hydrolase [Actinomycetospora sp. NBRC 106378]|uniref:alpha/beta fold hydrolase n=1 Tax=Actinomycetospora sp. NBRC 106378 TaxID=3032208 RepID=UPI0024A08700|nr:alpha/beta hydrolase [Actinomycetospora sp. NBRC 106378]GLZ53480.1 alpha/beta hydrolase [Actinomycetospora sp. NBRC 106378]